MRPFAPCFSAVPSTAVDLHTSQRELLKVKCCNQAAGMLPVEALTSLLLGLMLWASTLPKPSQGGVSLRALRKGLCSCTQCTSLSELAGWQRRGHRRLPAYLAECGAAGGGGVGCIAAVSAAQHHRRPW